MENPSFILDTNIWISYIVTGRYTELTSLIQHNKLRIYTCQTLIEELILVLNRPKIKKVIDVSNIGEIISIHKKISHELKPDKKINIPELSDPDDVFLAQMSYAIKVDYLVTGDKLLLKQASGFKCKVIRMADFIKMFAR